MYKYTHHRKKIISTYLQAIRKQLAKNLKHIFFTAAQFFFKCYLPVCSGICAATNSLHSYMTKKKISIDRKI